MNIFVTGSTGFIGSHFVNLALAENHTVYAIRRSESSIPSVPMPVQPNWIDKPLGSVSKSDLEGMDCLVHLAAVGVSPRNATWDEMMAVNLVDGMKMMETASLVGLKRWVVAGTYAEYGKSTQRFDFTPADAPLEPTFAYAASKAAFYLILRTLAKEVKAELYYSRLSSAFGIGQHRLNLWPSLCEAAVSGENYSMTPGEQIRDFVPVETVARELLNDCTDSTLQTGLVRTKNVGSGNPQSVRSFCEYWWKAMNAKGSLLVGDKQYRDHEQMRSVPLVGWIDD